MEFIDRCGKTLKDGDIIDIHQPINGENIFVVLDAENLDIRYGRKVNLHYEYDKRELLTSTTPEDLFEIVGNIQEHINHKHR